MLKDWENGGCFSSSLPDGGISANAVSRMTMRSGTILHPNVQPNTTALSRYMGRNMLVANAFSAALYNTPSCASGAARKLQNAL